MALMDLGVGQGQRRRGKLGAWHVWNIVLDRPQACCLLLGIACGSMPLTPPFTCLALEACHLSRELPLCILDALVQPWHPAGLFRVSEVPAGSVREAAGLGRYVGPENILG